LWKIFAGYSTSPILSRSAHCESPLQRRFFALFYVSPRQQNALPQNAQLHQNSGLTA
jgi:hypothetical protein